MKKDRVRKEGYPDEECIYILQDDTNVLRDCEPITDEEIAVLDKAFEDKHGI
ncbi:hypothetical protein [Peptococcus niger]|uniref:Uncharacterized protein n=1 Tax=Peptococcus niger TaxID=2741 RepID=A0A1G6YDM5_PEPNI|nr:hypothetical protein [Peptococcus niger]SDD88103.1 hypothetical protein SAMN04489866_10938 [Peptococcus niger]